jgi:hypothetical protein
MKQSNEPGTDVAVIREINGECLLSIHDGEEWSIADGLPLPVLPKSYFKARKPTRPQRAPNAKNRQPRKQRRKS